MNSMLQEILAQPGFSPRQLAIGAVMYGAWTVAYLCIIAQCFREKTYGVPWASLCSNVVWEFYFSFNLLDQRLFWFFLWGNRLWLLFDLVIVTQFLLYGREAQVIPFLRRHFHPAAFVTLALCAVGLATFTTFFAEFTGAASSMFMNLVMGILYLFLLFNRPDLRGLNYPAAWLKMIGTAAGSLFLYVWYPAQFVDGHLRTHPDVPVPRSWNFMIFLYVANFLVDCLYIALLARRRRELRSASEPGRRPSTAPAITLGRTTGGVLLCLAAVELTTGTRAAAAATAPESPAGTHAVPALVPGPAAPSPDTIERLRNLDLESLVTTIASPKAEPVFTTPAAVTAVSDEEIRRAGVRTVPDALRLVPGMEVAQINGNQWAVSARGFNDRFANKFLVLQDGRALYNPQYGGVYWDTVSPLLADLRQIEVVRGPGGTLWGANAVNGVVNIVTKDAHDTLGSYVSSGGGPDQAFAEARHGERIGDNGAWRAYFKYDWHDQLPLDHGLNYDGGANFATGFRSDFDLEANHLTFQGDYQYGVREQPIYVTTYSPPYATLAQEDFLNRLFNVLGRWTHTFADGTDLRLQAYYDHFDHNPLSFSLRYDVADFDLQHRLLLPWRQEVTYGAGYRLYRDRSENLGHDFVQIPASRDLQWYSGFVRDEIGLVEDTLKLILGTKLEHNSFTGAEVQPDARLLWLPSTRDTLWAGVSRAIRNPSRAHEDLTALQPMPFGLARYSGNPGIDSEELLSVQAGWRTRFGEHAGADISTYYNFYDRQDSTTIGTAYVETNPPPAHLILPVGVASAGSVDTYGVEVAADWQPVEWWQLRAGYSFFDYADVVNLRYDNAATPHHQFFLRSSMDLPRDLELDLWLRTRSELELYSLAAYADLDARLAWRPRPWVEVSVVGQNLCHDRRQDFGIPPFNIAAPVSLVPRTFYAQVTLRF